MLLLENFVLQTSRNAVLEPRSTAEKRLCCSLERD